MRDKIVAEARRWLGTPYRHQGHTLGVACDCVNLVHETMIAVGLVPRTQLPAYARRPDGTLKSMVDKYLVRTPIIEVLPGDVLLFAHPRLGPSHMGILSAPNTLIHAYAVNKCVVEHTLDSKWTQWIVGAYKAEGL